MEWADRLVMFLLGVLVTTASGGWVFGRTLAVHGAKLDHLESDVRAIRRVVDRRFTDGGGDP